jgi:Phosphotransferase enzyme family
MEELKRIVEQILHGQDSCFQEGRVLSFRAIQVMNRPLSKIIKLEVAFKNCRKNILIKVLKPKNHSSRYLHILQERVRRDFEITRSFHESFKNYPGYSTSKPVACLPELLATVMVESPGQNLRDLIVNMATFYPRGRTLRQLAEYSFACGQWLKIFQEITKDETQHRLQLEQMVKDIDLRLSRLVEQHGSFFSPRLRGQVIHYLERQALLVKDDDLLLCGVHGDFCPSNILIHGKEVIVLDFEMCKVGSVYQDVTYYLRHLDTFLQKPIFRPKTISILQQALLSGYDQNIDVEIPIVSLFRLRHGICHLVDILDVDGSPVHKRVFNKTIALRYIQWLKKATADSHKGVISDIHIPVG